MSIAYCEAQPPTFVKQPLVQTKTVHETLLQKKQNTRSVLYDVWELIKPDLGLLCLIILTAIGAAIVQLQTPMVTGQLINILSSVKELGSLTIRDLNKPAMKLFGLLVSQGLCVLEI